MRPTSGGLFQDKKGDLSQLELWIFYLTKPIIAKLVENRKSSLDSSPPKKNDTKEKLVQDVSKNPKDILYILLNPAFVPSYDLVKRTNSPHDPVFTVACVVHGEVIGIGTGGSLKKASSNAADDALKKNQDKVTEYAELRDRVKANGGKPPPKMRASISDQLEKGIYIQRPEIPY